MRNSPNVRHADNAHHVSSNISDEIANIVDIILCLYRIVLTLVEKVQIELKNIKLVQLFMFIPSYGFVQGLRISSPV